MVTSAGSSRTGGVGGVGGGEGSGGCWSSRIGVCWQTVENGW